jgi:hypothetical protein
MIMRRFMVLALPVLVIVVLAGCEWLSDRFYEVEDGIVKDKQTGLFWQKDNGDRQSFELAIKYCDDLVLGEHEDWRLPTLAELSTLFDNTVTSPPRIDIRYFPDTKQGPYMTSTTSMRTRTEFGRYGSSFEVEEEIVDLVDFGWGGLDVTQPNANVRCVRGERKQ